MIKFQVTATSPLAQQVSSMKTDSTDADAKDYLAWLGLAVHVDFNGAREYYFARPAYPKHSKINIILSTMSA